MQRVIVIGEINQADAAPEPDQDGPWWVEIARLPLASPVAQEIRDRLVLLGVLGFTKEDALERIRHHWAVR